VKQTGNHSTEKKKKESLDWNNSFWKGIFSYEGG
jgi:hypothetical protein